MLIDFLWSIATSYLVLGIVAAVLAAALIVGYFPLLKWFPVLGDYVPVAKLVSLLAMGLLCGLLGVRIADERAAAANLRSQLTAKTTDLTAAQNAAKQADEAKAEIAKQAQADQERIARYEDALKKRQDGGCALTDDDLRWLREPGSDR